MADSFNIDNIKLFTNYQNYFKLFDKYIPTGLTGNIMIFGIGNTSMIDLICAKNPKARYIIVDEPSVLDMHSMCLGSKYSIRVDETNTPDNFPVTDMKFDCIIMNPPYQRNLHLKILAEAIKHLNGEDSKVVNLSPIRWLEDPLASYKKNNDYHRFEESVGKHIEDAEIITAFDAQKLFEAGFGSNLGVYCCNYNSKFTVYQTISKDPTLNKIIPYFVTHNPVLERNKQEGWRVRIPDIMSSCAGNAKSITKVLNSLGKLFCFKDGKYKDGRWWYDCYKRNQNSKTTPYITNSILFEDEEKANNFIKQYDTYFAKYITDKVLSDVHVTEEKVLWMADAINPRTGKKGYESDWTDEDFCKFFDITAEEYEEIVKQATRYDKKK